MTGATAVRPRSRWALLLAVAAVTLAADQLSKRWALEALADGRPRELLGRFFALQLIGNSGAAFSIASGQTWVLTLIAVGIGVFVLLQLRRIANLWWAICLGLVLGGLLGNLWDRLVRPPSFGQGHVVDFLAYGDWFIGNVADIAIVGAAAGLVLLSLLGISYDTGRAPANQQGDPVATPHHVVPGRASEPAAADTGDNGAHG